MRRLIAALAALTLAFGLTTVLVGPAQADVTGPASNATLRGNATLSAGGASEGTLCFRGDSPRTDLQLINSGGTAVENRRRDDDGAFSYTIDTHNYPNGSYTVRAIERNRTGFAFCNNNTKTTNRSVTIDNTVNLAYSGDTSAPQNTTATVRATLTDPNLAASVLPGRPVSFSLSSGATVSGTTNNQGVATASLPVSGAPRAATLTVSFAATPFYGARSIQVPFTVNKNASTTTVAPPAPVVHGQSTSFTASVAAGNGTGTATGTVQFKVDNANLGAPVPLAGGAATSIATDSLSTGNHPVTAVYSGDGNFLPSTAATKTQTVNKAQTVTALDSDVSPTVSGQAVTFTASVDVVAPGVGQPLGAVQFNVDGNPFGTAVPLTGDTASVTISNLGTGNHDVVATYNGNADFAPSASATLTHGVNKAESSTALTTSNPNAVAGEPITFTADVVAVGPGAGTPTGSVEFFVDGNSIGSSSLSNGSATSPSVGLDAASHLVTANYAGDGSFAGSMQTLTQDVDAAATTTVATSSPNPSVFGQPVTLRAEVRPVSPATGNPQGAVQFFIDGSAAGVFASLQGGVAEIVVNDLAVGPHTVSARYLSGDANFVTSTSAEISQQVNKAGTETTISSSSNPSVFGQPVTFTATVDVVAPGAGSPSGTITFTDGATVLGTVPVGSGTGGQASVTTDALSVSQHAIEATYSGDESFQGSNGSVIQKVSRSQTSTIVASLANPAQSGQSVTFSAEVAPVAPGAGEPTGTVRFTVNGAPLGSPATVVDGVATSGSFASLTPGTYTISATYSGDGSFVGSTGGLDQGAGLDVVKGATEMTVASDGDPAAYGEAVTFTSTVTAVAPATGRPSGVVQIWEGSVLLGATSLEADGPHRAKASFVTTSLTPGAHEIRAEYVGNFNFEAQTALTSQTIGQVPTVTGIESSDDRVTFGDSVTLTAAVSSALPAPGAPTGTVTFSEGATVLGTATLERVQGRQQGTLVVDGLSGGQHQITATYSGDGGYAASTSAPFTQAVDRAASSIDAEVLVTYLGDNGGRVRATLTGNDGEGLAHQTLVFTTTQQNTDQQVIPICAVATDQDGFASCDATTLVPAINLNNGYDVDFAGNGDYLPATDHGSYFQAADSGP